LLLLFQNPCLIKVREITPDQLQRPLEREIYHRPPAFWQPKTFSSRSIPGWISWNTGNRLCRNNPLFRRFQMLMTYMSDLFSRIPN